MPFVKGVSGNPNGRPKGSAGLAETIRKKTKNFTELVRLMLKIARDGALDRDRIAAMEWLADRGLGKVAPTEADPKMTFNLLNVHPVNTVAFEGENKPTIEIDAKSQDAKPPPPSTASPAPPGTTISPKDDAKGQP